MTTLAPHPTPGPPSASFPLANGHGHTRSGSPSKNRKRQFDYIPRSDSLLNTMLAPLEFGDPMVKSTFAPSTGVREVVAGPPSPPGELLRLTPLQGVNGARMQKPQEGSNGAINGVAGKKEGKEVGKAVNGHSMTTTTKTGPIVASSPLRLNISAEAGPSTIRSTNGVVTPAQSTTSSPAGTPKKEKLKRRPLEQANGSTALSAGTPLSASTSTSPKKLTTPKQSSTTKEIPGQLHAELSDNDLSWPLHLVNKRAKASGLSNPSMACYANATLQVMMHTPPLLREIIAHRGPCELDSKFCLLCDLKRMVGSHWSKSVYKPPVFQKLQYIRKGFTVRKQEDSHEFFRFATDALQNQALAGRSKTLPEQIKHTSWVHRIWGGKVRSRVICSKCKQPSDTYDNFLDLSLDCGGDKRNVQALLRGFIKEDKLEGDNKYHCEKCKTKANASKSFRIAEAPPVLTLHLKRFSVSYNTYSGRPRANKYNDKINYEEYLDIAPYMVENSGKRTRYRLFGVTLHLGNELRFGHYVAHVRAADGRWFRADDEDVAPIKIDNVLNERSAYLLSYVRITEDEEDEGVGSRSMNGTPASNGYAKKRPAPESDDEEDEEEEEEEKEANILRVKRPFIGPVRPSPGTKASINGMPTVRPVSNGHNTKTPSLFPSRLENGSDSAFANGTTNFKSNPTPDNERLNDEKEENDTDIDSDDDNDNAGDVTGEAEDGSGMSAFGAEMNKGRTIIRGPRPIPAQTFYNKSPIARPRAPGPGPHSPLRSPHDRDRDRKSKKSRHGKHGRKGHDSPFAASAWGGKKKGTVRNMQGRKR